MYYEHFLFTRNTQRDFTAFVRPEEMTNKEVSVLARIIGYVNNVTWLTPEQPALYSFALGSYTYLLRHYDSGRTHAGRPIATLEGIAVKRTRTRLFAGNIVSVMLDHTRALNVSSTLDDIETQSVTTSPHFEMRPRRVMAPQSTPHDYEAVQAFAAQQMETRLVVPFTEDGMRLMITALTDPNIPPLLGFAFGTNADVVKEMATLGLNVDVVGYFNTSQPGLRSRETHQLVQSFKVYPPQTFTPPTTGRHRSSHRQTDTIRPAEEQPSASALTGTSSAPNAKQSTSTPPAMPSDADIPTEDRGVLTPREMRHRARQMAAENTPIDTDDQVRQAEDALFGGGVLTPREMRRQMLEAEAQRAAEEGDTAASHWLIRLMRRIWRGL